MKHNDPKAARAKALANAIAAAREILNHLEDAEALPPTNIHWGHVGDANRTADRLTEISREL